MTHIDHVADRVNDTVPTTVVSANTERELLRAAFKAALDATDIDDRRSLLDALGFNKPDTRARLDKARATRKAAKR